MVLGHEMKSKSKLIDEFYEYLWNEEYKRIKSVKKANESWAIKEYKNPIPRYLIFRNEKFSGVSVSELGDILSENY